MRGLPLIDTQRQPEVHQLQGTVIGEAHVVWLNIPVDDHSLRVEAFVQITHRVGQIDSDFYGPAVRDGMFLEHSRRRGEQGQESTAVETLQHQERQRVSAIVRETAAVVAHDMVMAVGLGG